MSRIGYSSAVMLWRINRIVQYGEELVQRPDPSFATPSGGVAKDVSGYARLVNFNSFIWYRQYSERSLFMCLNHNINTF